MDKMDGKIKTDRYKNGLRNWIITENYSSKSSIA